MEYYEKEDKKYSDCWAKGIIQKLNEYSESKEFRLVLLLFNDQGKPLENICKQLRISYCWPLKERSDKHATSILKQWITKLEKMPASNRIQFWEGFEWY